MQVAIIDIGSNTARLLVAEVQPDGRVLELAQDGVHLALGEELAAGNGLTAAKIGEVAAAAHRFARIAHEHDVERAEAIVTAPGRGPGGAELVRTVGSATGWPARVLSADDEGRLAYDGAVARADDLPEVVGVVDVGGGSSEIVVGTPLLGGAWVRSLTTGSLHLTRLLLRTDPPTAAALRKARDAVRQALVGVEPPRPDVVLAAGGSARAVARVIGKVFGPDDLDEVVRITARRPAKDVAETFGIRPARAETLAAGATVLAETARLFEQPFTLARGGLREGAALMLAAAAQAAAAA
jgi:exopolyphosphatase / guanosine-5'-triphosphate,3'-diphosphate pyrophosphatase